ncbi:MAG: Pr6Pr family membrane protein [Anaerolineae bacterium]|jgi:hypothetical protein|nr:Pr6Pr family membrane protein [Chloroflexota bacterium]
MHIGDRAVALAYRLAAAATVAVALGRLMLHPTGIVRWEQLNYFTFLSALWGLLLLAASALQTAYRLGRSGRRGSSALPAGIVGAVTLSCTITMLVYHLVLFPHRAALGLRRLTAPDLMIHYVTPLVVIGNWLLLVPKGRYRALDPLLWLLLPLAYLGYSMLRAALGGSFPGGERYPYYFIDVDIIGWRIWWRNVALCLLAFGALGYLYYGLDAGLAWLGRRIGACRQGPGRAE